MLSVTRGFVEILWLIPTYVVVQKKVHLQIKQMGFCSAYSALVSVYIHLIPLIQFKVTVRLEPIPDGCRLASPISQFNVDHDVQCKSALIKHVKPQRPS